MISCADVICRLQCGLMSCRLLLLWTELLWTNTAAPVTRWKTHRKKTRKIRLKFLLKNWGESGQFSFLNEHLKKASFSAGAAGLVCSL